jgi:DNA-binding NarL/FixJ family response regulator
MTARAVNRVLLADDHLVVRRGLRLVLDSEPDLRVVAEASDGVEAVERGLAQPLELAILDVSMPGLTGIQAARQLIAHRPELRVLILSMHAGDRYRLAAMEAGAGGYVPKAVADRELVAACRAVIRGDAFVYPEDPRQASPARGDGGRGRVRAPAGESVLSPRELEVAKLVAEGNSTREIADALMISEKTVERHRGSVLDKLRMRDRVDLTRWAIREGLVEA